MQATGPASPLLDPHFVTIADDVHIMVLVRQLMGRRNEKRKIEARELKKRSGGHHCQRNKGKRNVPNEESEASETTTTATSNRRHV